MAICDSPAAFPRLPGARAPRRAAAVDRFLEDATELGVDALADGKVLERRGDGARGGGWSTRATRRACCRPRASRRKLWPRSSRPPPSPRRRGGGPPERPVRRPRRTRPRHRGQPARIADRALRREGHRSYLVRHAVRLMLGAVLDDLDLPAAAPARQSGREEAVLPFARFGLRPGAGARDAGDRRGDGPRRQLPEAFAKAQRGAGQALPRAGAAFISAQDADKPRAVALAARHNAPASGSSRRRAPRRRSPRPACPCSQ